MNRPGRTERNRGEGAREGTGEGAREGVRGAEGA